MMYETKPLISISMITYNHEKFIRQAVESVLAQNFDSNFELVISNDNSQDNTHNIVQEIIKTHPLGGKIKYFKHKKNLGMMSNFIFAIEICKGNYIALCEGDDYWTDPLKLNKQISFLERNLEYAACFTNAKIINEHENSSKKFVKSLKNNYPSNEIVKLGGGFFPTASLVFRNQEIIFPKFMYQAMSGDYSLALLLACRGDFYYLDNVTCVYRMHGGGVFTSIKDDKKIRTRINFNSIELLKNFNEFSNFKFKQEVRITISSLSKKILLRNKLRLETSLLFNLMSNLSARDNFSVIFNLFRPKIP